MSRGANAPGYGHVLTAPSPGPYPPFAAFFVDLAPAFAVRFVFAAPAFHTSFAAFGPPVKNAFAERPKVSAPSFAVRPPVLAASLTVFLTLFPPSVALASGGRAANAASSITMTLSLRRTIRGDLPRASVGMRGDGALTAPADRPARAGSLRAGRSAASAPAARARGRAASS